MGLTFSFFLHWQVEQKWIVQYLSGINECRKHLGWIFVSGVHVPSSIFSHIYSECKPVLGLKINMTRRKREPEIEILILKFDAFSSRVFKDIFSPFWKEKKLFCQLHLLMKENASDLPKFGPKMKYSITMSVSQSVAYKKFSLSTIGYQKMHVKIEVACKNAPKSFFSSHFPLEKKLHF